MSTPEARGPSVVRFEPPDTCVCAFVGDVSEAEMRRIRDEQNVLLAGKSYALMLVDLARVGTVTSAARKVGAEKPPVPVFGTAIFGASFAIRVLAQLVTTAGSIRAKANDSPVRFFASEDLGRSWLAERRAVALRAAPSQRCPRA